MHAWRETFYSCNAEPYFMNHARSSFSSQVSRIQKNKRYAGNIYKDEVGLFPAHVYDCNTHTVSRSEVSLAKHEILPRPLDIYSPCIWTLQRALDNESQTFAPYFSRAAARRGEIFTRRLPLSCCFQGAQPYASRRLENFPPFIVSPRV